VCDLAHPKKKTSKKDKSLDFKDLSFLFLIRFVFFLGMSHAVPLKKSMNLENNVFLSGAYIVRLFCL